MKINKKQFQTKNFKGVLSLLAGNMVSKLVVTIGGFFLAKYYGPESYGVYNVFLSYVMILPVLTSFRLDNIMMLQKSSTEVRNLFSGIVWFSLFTTALLVSVLFLLKAIKVVNLDLTNFTLLLCGIGAVLTSWNNTQNALFTKFKLFKQMSLAFVLTGVFSVIFQGIFYCAGWTKEGLIYGWLVGLMVSFIYNARVSKDRLGKVDISLLKKNVKENLEIVKYTYPSDSINVLANYILPILAIGFFTTQQVGVYSMASKILVTPLILLSGSVSRVYFQKALTLYEHNPEQLKDLTYRMVFSNVVLIFLFVVAMNTIGIYLLELFLKNEWQGLRAGILALSFWIVARSAFNPIANILVVIKKNYYSLVFNIYLLVVNFIAIYIGVVSQDFMNCIISFSFLSGLAYLVITIVVMYNLNQIKKTNES